MKHIVLFIFLVFCTSLMYSQDLTISGNVKDLTFKEPLPGVNVIVKNTVNGTTTDFDGNFILSNVNPGDVISFSYLGFVTKEIVIKDGSDLQITMEDDVSALEEVIVVGYGTQKKSNVIGSVASVDVAGATAIPTTNVSEMLRGKATGVQINLDDARPGGNSNILIRGVRTLGNTTPLFVVDGLPFDDINDVTPDDIANIEILKDAASTAIYGSRGANGVVLITTKKGKSGKISVNYHGYTTVQSITKNFNQYTGDQYIDLKREANRIRSTGAYLRDENIFSPFELEAIENREFVDWEDLILNDAVIQSHSLSVAAGSEKTKVFSSISYFNQDGIIPNSGFNRGTFKLNLEQKINDKFSIKAILNYQNNRQNRESGSLDLTTITPLARPFDENGELLKFYLGPTNTNVNPLWNQRESEDETEINLTDVNVDLNYNITPSFSYTLKTFLRKRNTNRGIYRSSLHSFGDEGINGVGELHNSLYTQTLVENIFNYTPKINDKHSLQFTGVQAFDQQKSENFAVRKTDFINDALGVNGKAANVAPANVFDRGDGVNSDRLVTQRRLLSFLGRVRYGYLDKYLLEVTARADGASVFAENKKWGYFPAASLAWKAHKESFLEDVESINELKFRVSYGTVGNQSIGTLQSLGVADNVPYTFVDSNGVTTIPGGTPSSQLPNPNLTWETSTTFNAGVDFRLFNNLFEGSFEFYDALSKDVLLRRRLPESSGFAATLFNIGEIQNKGFEARLNTNIINKENLQWSIGVNFTTNKNEVLELTGETDADGNSIDVALLDGRRLSVGQSINNIWLPQYDGIWQEGEDIASSGTPLASPGDVRVIDQDGNGQIDERDNVYISKDPDWFSSINTTFRYKGLELFADFFIVEGATNVNPVLENGELWKGSINGIRTKYYTPESPSTEYPRPKPDTHVHLSSFAIRDASYVRLRTLSLGYNIPNESLSKIGLSSAKVYVTGTNLLTFTDFQSFSPEQAPTFRGEFGETVTSFPESRNLTIGLKLGF